MTLKQVALSAASLAALALLGFIKFKLAVSGTVWWVLLLGGMMFAVSTPAVAE